MEKRIEVETITIRHLVNQKKRIVLTGPESTAKSTLSKLLAAHYGGLAYPEFARDYLCGKTSHYEYSDVEAIAHGQLSQYRDSLEKQSNYFFFDTWLIVTKIWFRWVYKQEPDWLEPAIVNHPMDLYLLCKPDIPWEPDPLRENGGEQREKLFHIYRNELVKRAFPFVEIGGEGEVRLQNAIDAIDDFNFSRL